MTDSDLRDRVTRLEEQMKHLAEGVGDIEKSQADTNKKVTEMWELLLQGKGAAWAWKLLLALLISLVGAGVLKIMGAAHWVFGK